jgi:PKD repeat protein
MKTMMKASVIAVFLAALAVASGCEDSPITAGKDYQMYLVALPPTVRVNPDAPTDPLTSTIVATIVNDKGVPTKGLLVFFSADGGVLASGNQPISTDSNGNAYDTLTIQPGGPGDIVVTATSTSLTDTVTVTNGACSSNLAPTAAFTPPPSPDAGRTGDDQLVSVTSSSSDAGSGTITSYAWDCGNQTSGGTAQNATCTYRIDALEKIYQITLTVKDNGLGGTAPYACQKSASVSHPVTIKKGTAAP